ncbi:MAG: YCF48-related protein [Polyangiaceae bacterium]
MTSDDRQAGPAASLRRPWLLFGAAGVLALLAARQLWRSPPQAEPSSTASPVAATAKPTPLESVDVPLRVFNPHLARLSFLAGADVALALGSEGTVLRSSDDGQSWRRVETGTHEFLFDCAQHPSGALVVVGSHGTLLRSTDQGQSFSPISVDTKRSFRAASVSSSGAIVVVGDEGTAYASSDAGQRFLPENSGVEEYLSHVVSLPDGRVLIGGDHGTFLLREPSGTYRPVATDAKYSVTALERMPDGTLLAGVQDGFVLASSDNGASFRIAHQMPQNVFAIGFDWNPDASAVFARMRTYELLFSSDRAKSFQQLPVKLDQPLSKLSFYPGHGFVGFGSKGTLVRSDVSGQKFELDVPKEPSDVFAVEQNPKTHTLIVAGGSGYIARSTDEGQHLKVVQPALGGAVQGLAFQPKCVLAVGMRGSVVRSLDGLRSWQRGAVALDPKLNLTGVASDPKTGAFVVSGSSGTLLRSVDCGETFTPIAGAKNDVQGLFTSAEGALFALTTDSAILRSDDGGLKFSAVRMDADARPLAMVQAEAALVAVGEGGRIHRSVDGGQSFVTLPATTTNTLRGLGYDAQSKTLIAVGDAGTLLRSTDAGEHFDPVPLATSENLFVATWHPAGGQLLVGGNHGVVLRSLDQAKSFTLLATESTQTIRVIFFDPTSQEFIVAGAGGTLLRSQNGGERLARVRGSFEGRIDAALYHEPSKSVILGGDRLIRLGS